MNRDWLQLLTNIAVVVGLVLLIYELNQSRNLTRAQVVDTVYGAAITRNLALVGETPHETIAKSVFRPEDITESDTVVLTQFYTALLISWLRNQDETGAGYFGIGYVQVIATEAYFINTVPGRKWWNAVKGLQDPEIVKAVDTALAGITPEGQRQFLAHLLGENHSGKVHGE